MTATLTKKLKTTDGGRHPAEMPCYAPKEVAHYLQIPWNTLRAWVVGDKPIVSIADPTTPSLSFRDLVELHVLGAVRRKQPIQLAAVRNTIRWLEKSFGTNYPLSSRQMLATGKDAFIERYGTLVGMSEPVRVLLSEVLTQSLERIERNRAGEPICLYPFTRSNVHRDQPKSVGVDPRIQFGRPCIVGTRVVTEIVMGRYLAGDSIRELAEDYGCPTPSIEEAIRFETGV